MEEPILEQPVAPQEAPQQEAPAPAQPAAQPAPAAPQQDQPWNHVLPEDIRDNPNFTKYTSLESFAKGHLNAVRHLGSEKVPLPKTDDDWQTWYKAAGRPDEASGYQLPEVEVGAPEFQDNFRNAAYEAGLNQSQVEKLAAWYGSEYEGFAQSQEHASEHSRYEAENMLRREWGERYEQHIRAAQTVVRQYASEGMMQKIEATGIGNDPDFLRMLADIGMKTMDEGQLVGETQQALQTPDQLDSQISQKMKESAYFDKMDPDHDRLVKEVFALRQRRHG